MSTKYSTGNYVGLHKLNVNSNCRIEVSETHNCVDVFLKGVVRVEHKKGYIVLVSESPDGGRKHYVYIHHNLPTEVTA